MSYLGYKILSTLLTATTSVIKLVFISTSSFGIFSDVFMNKYVGSKEAGIRRWFLSFIGIIGLYVFTTFIFGEHGVKSIGGYIINTMILISFILIIVHWAYNEFGINDIKITNFINGDTDGYGIPLYFDIKKQLLERKTQKQVNDFHKKAIWHELLIKPGVMAVIILFSISDPRYLIISGVIFVMTLWQGSLRALKIRRYILTNGGINEHASRETHSRATGSAKNRL